MYNMSSSNITDDETNLNFANLDKELDELNASEAAKTMPSVPGNVAKPDYSSEFPSVPENRQTERTPIDFTNSLVQSALQFAVNAKSYDDKKLIKQFYDRSIELFNKQFYVMDPNQLKLAAVTGYLKYKTIKSGGKHKTRRNKKHHKLTRKRKQH